MKQLMAKFAGRDKAVPAIVVVLGLTAIGSISLTPSLPWRPGAYGYLRLFRDLA
jgi:hypothetical protein